jgi:UDP-glucose 4-epimerase
MGPLEQGNILDKARLTEVFVTHRPDAVLHCAASIEVGASVKHPDRSYENNVVGALTLLTSCGNKASGPFVFLSTCATYGEPLSLPMDETHRQQPVSPYGWTKLMVERISRDVAAAYGTKFAHLRYFSAAGGAPDDGVGEHHEPAPRRDGDAPALLADNALAKLGWTPERDIHATIPDAWKWHSNVEAKIFSWALPAPV